MTRYGTASIKGVPLTEDQITKLINRVAFVRQTLYGKEYVLILQKFKKKIATGIHCPLSIHFIRDNFFDIDNNQCLCIGNH